MDETQSSTKKQKSTTTSRKWYRFHILAKHNQSKETNVVARRCYSSYQIGSDRSPRHIGMKLCRSALDINFTEDADVAIKNKFIKGGNFRN
jgi:hypothetical protein